jgi:uncharacterized protein
VADRAVFDTNVYVSAYAFGGAPERLMRAVITGDLELVTSPAILAELARVLADKLGFDSGHVETVVRQIARVAVVVDPVVRLSVVADEADNRVLECALVGGAQVIVTGDRHLLDIGEHEGISVMTIAQMAEHLAAP